jgi:hypothetical protein
MKELLIWSVSTSVITINRIQGMAFFLKFCKEKISRKRYKGIQVLASRHQGAILSAKELVHAVLILRNKYVSH